MAYGVAGTSEDSGLASHPSELCHSPYIRSPKIIIWRRLQCSPDSVFGPADASAGCCSSSSATYVPGRARRAGRRARYVGSAGCPVARSRLVVQRSAHGSQRARGATVACERSLGDHWRRSSGSARRDRRRPRELCWRALARGSAKEQLQNFQSFQVSRSSYETSGSYGRKEERRELLLAAAAPMQHLGLTGEKSSGFLKLGSKSLSGLSNIWPKYVLLSS